jgi:hypothetical protein
MKRDTCSIRLEPGKIVRRGSVALMAAAMLIAGCSLEPV